MSITKTSGFTSAKYLLERFTPTPHSQVARKFKQVLQSVGSLVGNGIEGMTTSSSADLIGKQIEIQQQMQLTSMQSNIEKAKHETRMTPIRNLRVG